MSLTKARELREQRRKIYEQAQAVLNNPALNKEERTTQFDKHMTEMNDLKAEIDRYERLEALEQETRGLGAPPREVPGNNPDAAVAEKRAKAFNNYLKFGLGGEARVGRISDEDRQLVMEMRDMSTGGSGAGIATSGAGIFVPVGFVAKVVEAMKYYGPMLEGTPGMPDIMPTATGQILPFPTDNDTSNTGELVGENAQVTTQDISIGSINLGAFKFSSKMVRASIELLQDSAFDIESYLVKKFATRLGRIANTKFTNGVGVTEPYGIVTQSTSAGTALGAGTNDGVSGANTIGSDDLTTLEHSVDVLYRRQARYMMHDSTVAALKKVKDKYGRPLWLPGVAVNAPDTINGYPYRINNDMDQLQTQVGSPPQPHGVHARTEGAVAVQPDHGHRHLQRQHQRRAAGSRAQRGARPRRGVVGQEAVEGRVLPRTVVGGGGGRAAAQQQRGGEEEAEALGGKGAGCAAARHGARARGRRRSARGASPGATGAGAGRTFAT